jgi:hypothetical protein
MRYQIKIEDVKKDDILYKTESSKKLFMKGDYCRFERKYYAEEYEDINSGAYFKKGKIVYVEYDGYYEKRGIIKCAENTYSYGVMTEERYFDEVATYNERHSYD